MQLGHLLETFRTIHAAIYSSGGFVCMQALIGPLKGIEPHPGKTFVLLTNMKNNMPLVKPGKFSLYSSLSLS